MKRTVLVLAITLLAAAVSCNKAPLASNDTINKVTVDISVADLIPDTKAIKQNWENGDKICIWFKDVPSPNYSYWKQTPHLILTRVAGAWVSSEVDETLLSASGTFNAVYESSNSLFNNAIDNTYAYYPSGTSIHFTGNTNDTRVSKVPLVCVTNHAPYTYDSSTKKISGTISNWVFETRIQVVVSGLPYEAGRYALSFAGDVSFGECLFYYPSSKEDITSSGISDCRGFTDSFVNIWADGVSNSDGTAFYFHDTNKTEKTYTIYLADTVGKHVYSFTKTTSIQTSTSYLTGIKIAFSSFTEISSSTFNVL